MFCTIDSLAQEMATQMKKDLPPINQKERITVEGGPKRWYDDRLSLKRYFALTMPQARRKRRPGSFSDESLDQKHGLAVLLQAGYGFSWLGRGLDEKKYQSGDLFMLPQLELRYQISKSISLLGHGNYLRVFYQGEQLSAINVGGGLRWGW